MNTISNRYSLKVILLLLVFGYSNTLQFSAMHAATQCVPSVNPESMIEEIFNTSDNFADCVEKIIEVLLTHKEFFMAKFKLNEAQFDQFVVALSSVKHAVDITIVQKKVLPFKHLLPESILKKGTAAFAIRVKTMLYGNKKLLRKKS